MRFVSLLCRVGGRVIERGKYLRKRTLCWQSEWRTCARLEFQLFESFSPYFVVAFVHFVIFTSTTLFSTLSVF